MFKYSVLISALLILAMIFGCDDDPVKSLPFDYFPNEVRSVWTYDVWDSIANTGSEVTVEIVEYLRLENGQYGTHWIQTTNPESDPVHLYVFESGDSVLAYSNLAATELVWLYIVPLTVDQGWMVHHEGAMIGADSSTVTKIEPVSVPQGDFSSARLIETRTISPVMNYFYIRRDWFVPGVGLVKKWTVSGTLITETHESWTLKYYELPRPLPD